MKTLLARGEICILSLERASELAPGLGNIPGPIPATLSDLAISSLIFELVSPRKHSPYIQTSLQVAPA